MSIEDGEEWVFLVVEGDLGDAGILHVQSPSCVSVKVPHMWLAA